MTMLIAGLLIFLGLHSIRIVAPRLRDRLAAGLGEGPWKGLYSLLSGVGLALVVVGFGRARASPAVLYVPAAALHGAAVVLLAAVFPLLLAAYLPGRIRTALGHPMLAATVVWSLAHLLANGRLADVLLFGGFLAWATADWIALRRQPRAAIRTLPAGPLNDVVAVVGGLALYGAMLLGLHARLVGVAPIG